jgi:hypothetical protein
MISAEVDSNSGIGYRTRYYKPHKYHELHTTPLPDIRKGVSFQEILKSDLTEVLPCVII